MQLVICRHKNPSRDRMIGISYRASICLFYSWLLFDT